MKDIDESSILNFVVNHINEAVIICDKYTNIIKVNKACEELTGYKEDEVLGKNPQIFSIDNLNNDAYLEIFNTMIKNDFWVGEIWNRHKNGKSNLISLKIQKVLLGENELYYYAIFSNTFNSNDELYHLAYHDPLTNLANRTKLKSQMEYIINNAQRNSLKFAVIFLDLDNFKLLNDTFGHLKGDEFLIEISSKFKNIIRTNDIVARVGGDEFIMVLNDINDYLFIKRVCQKIIKIVHNSYTEDMKSIDIGISIGISIYPENGQDVDKLISNADIAMYQAKINGKNRFEFFSNTMNKRLVNYAKREDELLIALDNDDFIINFQPQLYTHTNEILSLEILTRLYKDKEYYLPSYFLEDLEVSNLIYKFDEQILDKACKQLKIWEINNIYTNKISINISGKSLKYSNVYDMVIRVCEKNSINPSLLELEFNEEDIMNSTKKIMKTLKKLENIGVTIVIDNFGKGFSSFNHLRDCSVGKLKIDKSYIDLLLEENNDYDIIRSIIDLGANMNIPVIAEGIEVSKQDEILKNSSCTQVQGYYYAKPMDAKSFESWIKQQKLN